jgi:hypothetical protein
VIRGLRALEVRRDMLIARSAALRGEIAGAVSPAARGLAAAQAMVIGLRRTLYWAVLLAPLYSLLTRPLKHCRLRRPS